MDIIFSKVNKCFGEKQVLSDFSLTIPKGKICLFGESGCGKTTLLNLIAGILKPESGEISGVDRRISYTFQKPRLLPWLNCLDNIAITLPDSKNKEKAQEMLSRFLLKDEMQKYPSELSGGMQQRVSLARALSFESEILLLDEPFNGLDDRLCEICAEAIRETSAEITVLVTHNAEHAKLVSNEFIYLSGPPLQQVRGIKNDI